MTTESWSLADLGSHGSEQAGILGLRSTVTAHQFSVASAFICGHSLFLSSPICVHLRHLLFLSSPNLRSSAFICAIHIFFLHQICVHLRSSAAIYFFFLHQICVHLRSSAFICGPKLFRTSESSPISLILGFLSGVFFDAWHSLT